MSQRFLTALRLALEGCNGLDENLFKGLGMCGAWKVLEVLWKLNILNGFICLQTFDVAEEFPVADFFLEEVVGSSFISWGLKGLKDKVIIWPIRD